MVAVDLVGPSRVGSHGRVAQTGADPDPAATSDVAAAQGAGDQRHQSVQRQIGDGHHGQGRGQSGAGNQVEGAVAEKGVGVGIEDHRKKPPVHGLFFGVADAEGGPASIHSSQPRAGRGVDEQRMAGPPLPWSAPFHLGHHGGVEPDPAMEKEVSSVHRTEPDLSDARPVESIEQSGHGVDRIVGKTQNAGEDVGAPAGEDGQGCAGSGQAVGRLVEGAVTTQDHHDVDAVSRRRSGQPAGVAPALGLDQCHLVVGRQRLADDHPAAAGDRRRGRIHDEQDPQRPLPSISPPGGGRREL